MGTPSEPRSAGKVGAADRTETLKPGRAGGLPNGTPDARGVEAAGMDVRRVAKVKVPGGGTRVAARPRVGTYQIVRELGRGGMGIVYEAEQANPRRKVALKVITPTLVTREMMRRFAHEAQLLGRLEHPGIARIYEAGTAPVAGGGAQPFFAMELVRGQRIDEFVRERRLTLKQRLRLFVRVVDAVHYAHQRFVIHRDLKPANLIVTDAGQPKILDFGIARATDSDLQNLTLQTESGHLIGTLQYMSPEQAGGNAGNLDIRSDVYALGLIGYELCTGRVPYDLRNVPLLDAVRVIQGEDPVALGPEAAGLPEDVRTILGKAMEKERARRYDSAAALSADVRRYLNHEPVAARAPTRAYRLAKFVRRNRVAVAALSAVAGALVVGLVSSLMMYGRAEAARVEADRAGREEARQRTVAETQARHAKAAEATASLERAAAEGEAVKARAAEASAEKAAGQARAAETLAQAEAARAKTAEALARRRLAEALVSQGNAYAQARRWEPAGASFRSGRAELVALGLPTDESDLGLAALFEASPPPLLSWQAHESFAYGIDLAADGRTALTGGRDRQVHVWDVVTGRRIRTLGVQPNPVSCVAFLPDGRRALVGGDNGLLKLWDVATGQELRTFQPIPGWVGEGRAIRFSPDGRRALVGHGSGAAVLWDVESGAVVQTLRGHTGQVSSVALLAGGALAATTGIDGRLILWDLPSGRARGGPPPVRGVLTAVADSPDGRRLAVGNSVGDVFVVDVEGGTATNIGRHQGWVFCATFGADGRHLYTSAADRTIKVWDMTGAGAGTEQRTLVGHTKGVTCVVPSRDGRVLVTSGQDGTVRTWSLLDSSLATPVRKRSTRYSPVAMPPDGKAFLLADGAELRLMELASGKDLRTVSIGRELRAVALTADARLAVGGVDGGGVYLWDLEHGRLLTSFAGHPGRDVRAVAISPDARRVASAGSDGRVVVWDADTGREVASVSGFNPWNWSVQFSPDGRSVVFPRVLDVCVWKGFEGPDSLINTFQAHDNSAATVMMSADGSSLLSGGHDHRAYVWDASTGAVRSKLLGHGEFVAAAAFTAGGRRAVTVSGDTTVRVWGHGDGKGTQDVRPALRPGTRSGRVRGRGRLGHLRRRRHGLPLGLGARATDAGARGTPGRRGGRLAGDGLDGTSLAALGEACAAAGLHDWAVEVFLKARGRGGKVGALALARSYWAQGKEMPAEADAKRTLAVLGSSPVPATRPATTTSASPSKPATVPVVRSLAFDRANDLTRAGRYKDAAAAWEAFVGKDPASPRDYYWLAGLQLAAGDIRAYRAVCAAMANRVANDAEPVSTRLLVKMSAWHADAGGPGIERLVEMARRVVERDGNVHTSWQTLGVAQLRAGALDQAYDSLRTAFTKPNPFPYACAEPQTDMLIAITLHRMHRPREAAEAAKRGRAGLKRQDAEIRKRPLNNGLGDVILCELLIKEFDEMTKSPQGK